MRFPGFGGEWKESSFSEAFSFLSNNTLSRAELSDEGKIKNIHYGDVLIKFGDVIVADTAEDDTVGKATEILNTNNIPIISGLHTIPCRIKASVAYT